MTQHEATDIPIPATSPDDLAAWLRGRAKHYRQTTPGAAKQSALLEEAAALISRMQAAGSALREALAAFLTLLPEKYLDDPARTTEGREWNPCGTPPLAMLRTARDALTLASEVFGD